MAFQNQVLLFPDDDGDLLEAIHELNVRSKTRPQVRNFLTAASNVIHREAAALDRADRGSIGDFDDLVHLAELHISQTHLGTVARMVLLTAAQIGRLVILAEENQSILLPVADDALFPTGFGTGCMAAAVAATATTTDSVVTLGLEAVAIAFRLAVNLQRIGRNIEDSDGQWSCVVSGVTRDELDRRLETINSTLHPLHHAYVAQVISERIVIAGPPSTLDIIYKTPDLAPGIKAATSPFRSPLHGSHLPPVDMSLILGSSPILSQLARRPLYSACSPPQAFGSPASLQDLFQSAVNQIAHHPIHLDGAVDTLASALKQTDRCNAILTSLGSNATASEVKDLLQRRGQILDMSEPTPWPKPFGDDVDSIPPDAIAVVGMSGRFPDSDSVDEFWELLQAGKMAHQEIPSSRFEVNDFYDPSREKHNALLARHGCFIKSPGDFDHRLFNISPREALQMDPVQRMLLMTTYEALEMAGYTPTTGSSGEQALPRIATYFGQTTDDWKGINEQQGIDTHFLPGVNRGFGPGRLSHYFRWAGGFYSIDTGCSSSATAICLARDALAAGEYDAAVVGGGTLLNAPEWFAGLSQGGFLSPTGACKTFSDDADGYCRGEGVGIVVLKRLSDAVRSRDNVLAVVAGAARNCNGGAGSITHPGEEAQASLYWRVLRQASVRPHEVGMIEMHGTGTQAGDRVEMQAVQRVFASPNRPRREQPLVVGAVKANIGHSEAAAGIISLIKAILILQHSSIPPQPNQPLTLNRHLAPILGGDIQLANGQAWPRSGTDPRYIFINNFDAAGGNVSVLIHDAPSFAMLPRLSQPDVRTSHVVATSGRTATAHEANRRRLHQYLMQNPDTPLSDLAFTSTARRMHNVHRDAFVVTSTRELLQKLEQTSTSDVAPTAPAPAVVFAFTGQGSQYVGMGGTLYRTSATFRRLLDSYQSLCDAQGLDCRFIDAIRGSEDTTSITLSITERDLQVATVALEIALARYWQGLGIRATLVIGHSLGEYAALCVSGVISVGDALALAHKRASLIFSRCPPSECGMLAVALPVSKVQWRLRDSAATAGCEICCVNGPSSTVVGGPIAAIEALEEYLKSENVSMTRLRVQHAFHTRQMDVLLEDLEISASSVAFRAPTIPLSSTVLGRVVQAGEEGIFDAQYLRRHTREPVRFLDAVRACEADGLIPDQTLCVEIGPHPTCINLMLASVQETKLQIYPSLRRGRDDWQSISECLAAAYRAQLPVDWLEFHRDHLRHLRFVKNLPTYAFDKKSFWLSYKTMAPGNSKGYQPQSGGMSVLSASLQSASQMQKKGTHCQATFTVDLSDENLARAIGGHMVDGVAICPASIFIDMACTAATYLEVECYQSSDVSLVTKELANLSMHSPLVLREGDDKPPRVWVEGDLDQSTNVVSVRFRGQKQGPNTSAVDYGSCVVRLGQPESATTAEWSRIRPLIKARVCSLDDFIRPREVHAMDRRLFYKIFSEIVDYSADYHAVEEAVIAADFRDAAVVLEAQPGGQLGTFTCSPFVIDALVHVAGFLLNANVHKPKNEVHIANHIGSLRVVGDLSSRGPYRAYAVNREQDVKSGTSLCDVYLTDNKENLVALCTDICFKKLEREFFALLTGSAAAQPRKLRPQTSPRVEWEAAHRSSSSSSSGTATPRSSSSAPSSVSDVMDLAAELLDAVAARSGMSQVEIKKSTGTTFTEMGVDSQMSIAILADFQKTTGVELPAAFFTNFPTPADVEKELGSSPIDDVANSKPVSRSASRDAPKPRAMAQRVPPSQHLFGLVADALGLDASDLTPSTTFESVGMDSMLSIKIIAAFERETQIEVPAAFFTEHRTVAMAREALDTPFDTSSQTSSQDEQQRVPSPVKSAPQHVAPAGVPDRQHKIDSAVSRAVLIHGQSRSRAAPLFMTTDGSGTVESYIHLQGLPQGRRIYALESPFLETPETFDLSIEEMASVFLRTIRRIQPHGPYLIGGWSAGSMYAYEVAHRLVREGETVAALIILDMRAPSLIPTTIVTTDFVDKLGTFEGINRARDLPEDLSVKEKAHLMATCRALSRYDAPAFPPDRQPRNVAVVWARLGLDNRPDAPVAAMTRPGLDIGKSLTEMTLPEFERYFNSWFYGRREQFGTNGWETLLGDSISVHTVDGDHFSMMAPPFSQAVGSIVVDTVARAVADE